MQIGVASNLTTNNRSVGQRIKDAHLKDPCGNSSQQQCSNNDQSISISNRSSKAQRVSRNICPSYDRKKFQEQQLSPLQKNTIRIIGQYLLDLGMSETVDSLFEESGTRIEEPMSMQLRDRITCGHWDKSLQIIEKFRSKSKISAQQYLTIRVLLLEEKFKELLSRGEVLLALRLLQLDYPKDEEVRDRLEYWATVLCSPNPVKSSQKSQNSAKSNSSSDCLDFVQPNQHILDVLRKILPPDLMLPPNRLQELLKQSLMHQVKQCDLHNADILSNDRALGRSILTDHQCTNTDFPTKNTTTLYLHNAEVWCLKFSPCGTFLASGAKGNNVLVWKVDSPERITIHQNITIHQDIVGIGSLSWSYDSRYLAVASTEENGFGVFIYYIPAGRLVKEYHRTPHDSCSTVSFFKNRSYKLACGDQRGHFHAYDIHSQDELPYASFEGFRIRCIYSMKDGKTVLAADTHNRIRSYDFENKTETNLIQENSQILYFTVDRYEKYCLVTTKLEGIRLWCLKTCTLVRRFLGANHNEFIITTSFGGMDGNFIASGSEDETIVIWNINYPQPVRKLAGHTGTVNAVSWNPAKHGMLASGSDDGTIKIWCSTSSLK